MKFLVGTKEETEFQKMINQWKTSGFQLEFEHISFEGRMINYVIARYDLEDIMRVEKKINKANNSAIYVDEELPF
jgi:hypothetical protein